MFVRDEECFYYLTVYNESYDMPAMPGEQVREGIIRGLYPFKTVKPDGAKHEVQTPRQRRHPQRGAAGPADPRREVRRREHGLQRDELPDAPPRRDRVRAAQPPAPGRPTAKMPYVQQVLGNTKGPVVATSDYMRALPEQVAPYLDGRLLALGTDGFGRARRGKALRRFFEVDAEHVARRGAVRPGRARRARPRRWSTKAIKDLGIEPGRPAAVDGVNRMQDSRSPHGPRYGRHRSELIRMEFRLPALGEGIESATVDGGAGEARRRGRGRAERRRGRDRQGRGGRAGRGRRHGRRGPGQARRQGPGRRADPHARPASGEAGRQTASRAAAEARQAAATTGAAGKRAAATPATAAARSSSSCPHSARGSTRRHDRRRCS